MTVSAGDNFMLTWIYSNSRLMFTMKCKTTGWCAVAFTTGDGSGMRDYDIALGGVASNNYLGVSGMEYHSCINNYPPLEHMTDASAPVYVLDSFPPQKLRAQQMPISSRLYETEITNDINCEHTHTSPMT